MNRKEVNRMLTKREQKMNAGSRKNELEKNNFIKKCEQKSCNEILREDNTKEKQKAIQRNRRTSQRNQNTNLIESQKF